MAVAKSSAPRLMATARLLARPMASACGRASGEFDQDAEPEMAGGMPGAGFAFGHEFVEEGEGVRSGPRPW
jgi:hypothetical protein